MSNQLQITGGAKVRSLEGVITGTSGVLSSLPINTSNGIPQLDVNGKILVSQLPNSVMEYKGTWSAATNTPTLADGTGNQGDVYLCNVAGTVNFGSGPIQFYVGDQVIYSGTIWQRASGASGTVTSVAITESGDALSITGSPITTSGTINIGFAGTSAQYIAGDGSLVTFPSIITQAQNLVTEVYNRSGATITKGTIVYINGGQGNLPTIAKALATSDATSAQTYGVVQADITNMNNGYVVVAGRLQNIDTQAYTEGTQLYLSSTTAGAWTSTKQYAPAHLVYVGIVVRSHPTQGIVEIKIQNGYELDELHNVSAQTPSNNDGLFYNSSNSLWENKSIATALGYTPLGGSGTAGNVPYYTAANTLGSENGFMYDSSTNRFGVNTTVPNATIGANASIDSGYSLLLKNADANYNGLGFGLDSTYGNLITTQKIGTANARNFTLQNQSGYVSIDESGNFGVNILTPKGGVDIYSSTTAALYLHNSASGVAATDGVRLSLNSTNANLRNYESGTLSMTSEGDFSVITAATENFRVNSADGSIYQSKVANAMLKSVSGVITAAVAGTDYLDPSSLSGYVPTSRTISINGTTQDLSSNRSWSVGTLTGGGAASRVAFWDGASNVVSDSLFVWDDTNNRLGIGLTNPQRSLEIYSATADTHLRLSGNAPSVSMGEAITGSIYQAKFGLATANNQFVTGSVAGDFVINNQTGATIWAYNSIERMRLDTNGNMGIGGIAGSSYRLNVFAASPMVGIESTGSGNMFLRFLQTGDVKGSLYWINADSTLYLSNNYAGIKFVTSGANPALTLASTGAATLSSSLRVGGATGNFIIDTYTTSKIGVRSWTDIAGTTNNFFVQNSANYNYGVIGVVSATGAANGDVYGLGYTPSAGTSMTPVINWTSGGNVGIGTTSPIFSSYAQLTVKSSTAGGIVIQGGATDYSRLFFAKDDTSSVEGLIRYYHSDNSMQFFTSATERMRITSGGELCLNTTSVLNSGLFSMQGATSAYNLLAIKDTGTTYSSSNNFYIYFVNSTGGAAGGISHATATTVNYYSGPSDARLKSNIIEVDDSVLPLFDNVKLKTYNHIADEDESVVYKGFLAQEMVDKFPEAYGLDKDGYYMYNPNGYIPYLVKAIQELKQELDELKAKIN
jgi:3D (Asp-Asp-Asp) domain-containing protein